MKDKENLLDDFFNARRAKLLYYSPYWFIKDSNFELQWDSLKISLRSLWENSEEGFAIDVEGQSHFFLVEKLKWDSDFFGKTMIRLHTVLFDHTSETILDKAVGEFKRNLLSQEHIHCYIKIPAEDILLAKSLCSNGFLLVESRLDFYKDVNQHHYERFETRVCNELDAGAVRRVAEENSNDYDRFHADSFFTSEEANRFLGEYGYNCVMGYSDYVLTPSNESASLHAFLAIKHLSNDVNLIGEKSVRIALTAVGPQAKGWHLKLCSEAIFFAKEHTAKWLFMTTQSTNTAVFKTCHKLGFCLGGVENVFSISNK